MLASDLNNPEFMNPVNPDNLLHVEFYMHEPINKWDSDLKTYETGRKTVIKMPGGPRPYIRIMRPGDNTSIVETEVREDHKARWPTQWLYFQMQNGMIDSGENIPGWKVEEWEHLKQNPELLRDLKYMRFFTVEQIAGASDAQVQKMGIGGLGLREQARQALRDHMGAAVKAEIEKKDREMAEVKAQLAELQARLNTPQTPVVEQTKKRRGRPPKVKEAAVG